MTPDTVPRLLHLVHLRAAVEGVVLEKVFEADPNLKYTFAWDRLNAYKQKVYGIVTARGEKQAETERGNNERITSAKLLCCLFYALCNV